MRVGLGFQYGQLFQAGVEVMRDAFQRRAQFLAANLLNRVEDPDIPVVGRALVQRLVVIPESEGHGVGGHMVDHAAHQTPSVVADGGYCRPGRGGREKRSPGRRVPPSPSGSGGCRLAMSLAPGLAQDLAPKVPAR